MLRLNFFAISNILKKFACKQIPVYSRLTKGTRCVYSIHPDEDENFISNSSVEID